MVHKSTKFISLFLSILAVIVLTIIARTYLADIPVAVVKGNSMLPLLREGDIVFIVKANPSEIKEGDVIVFWTPNNATLIIHRVIKVMWSKNTAYYITKGDNNPFEDKYYSIGVPYSKVVGKVASIGNSVYKIPYIGHLALIFR